MLERAAFLARASQSAARVYASLARDETTPDAAADEGPRLRLEYRPAYKGTLDAGEADVSAGLLAQMKSARSREIAQGANVVGPHRDDIAFLLQTSAGAMDLEKYGSRGQQRSAALALKLAELEYIEAETSDQPILLLDDVLSELDAQRRTDLLQAVSGLEQVVLTTTELSTVPASARAHARIFMVHAGQVQAMSSWQNIDPE
jgi:DNA replication and repair protein RecF